MLCTSVRFKQVVKYPEWVLKYYFLNDESESSPELSKQSYAMVNESIKIHHSSVTDNMIGVGIT